MFPQTCAHYVVLGNAGPIASAYSYSESGGLDTDPFAYGSLDIVSVGTILFASDFGIPIPDSTHLPDIKILVCAHSGIAHPISASWYAECLEICYGVTPYRYAVCFGNDHQIPPYRYAVYSDIVHHIPP